MPFFHIITMTKPPPKTPPSDNQPEPHVTRVPAWTILLIPLSIVLLTAMAFALGYRVARHTAPPCPCSEDSERNTY